MFKVKIPKILFLALDIASFYRNNFFNTNDLATLANKYKKELVRLRVDKKDYRYLDDTNFGGLRGNFSTLLTWRGFVKRGSNIVSTYSIGKDKRLVNAINKGEVILNSTDFSAHTNDPKLKALLENEAWLLTVRETQAHVKMFLQKHPSVPLERDNNNYPKHSVFVSSERHYFIRSLVNNFVDTKSKVLEFNLLNLWEGNKFKKKNLHPLIVLPTKKNPWNEIYAIKNEDLYENKPLLLKVNLETKKCHDEYGNSYMLHPLESALQSFSRENENFKNRLNYNWDQLKEKYCEREVETKVRKEDEFSNFLRLFLEWKKSFSINGKEIADIKVISSGGADVELIFSGGTTQKLELEHAWNNYLDHGHHKNSAFKDVWIFSEEKFDLEKILKLFAKPQEENGNRIPDIFLSIDVNFTRSAHEINWKSKSARKLDLKF